MSRVIMCSPTSIRLVLDHDGNNHADVVNFSTVELLVWVKLLDFFCKRSISLSIHTRHFGFTCNGNRKECLKIVLVLFGDPTFQRDVANAVGHIGTFWANGPDLKSCHMSTYDLEHVGRAQIIPDAVGGEHKYIAMAQLMVCDAGLTRIVAQRRSTKYLCPGQDFGWDDRELVWCVESMRLRVRIMVDGI